MTSRASLRGTQLNCREKWMVPLLILGGYYPISVMDGTTRQKIRKETEGLENTIKQLEQTHVSVKVTQLCQALCNPMDYTVQGILQARILE